MSLRSTGVLADRPRASRLHLSASSRCHWRTAVRFVVRISVLRLTLAIAAMATIVLPAPQGSTTTPEPPFSLPPAQNAETACSW